MYRDVAPLASRPIRSEHRCQIIDRAIFAWPMKIGTSLSGLSILLPAGLVVTVFLARAVAISFRKAPDTLQTWFAAYVAGYVVYLIVGLVATEALRRGPSTEPRRTAPLVGALIAAAVVVTSRLSVSLKRPSLRGRGLHPGIALALLVFAMVAGVLFWLGAVAAPELQAQ